MLLRVNDNDVLIEVSKLDTEQTRRLADFLVSIPSASYQYCRIGEAITHKYWPWNDSATRTAQLHKLGGHGIITAEEVRALKCSSNKTLFDMFLDGECHTAEEISIVSHQQEGVKRMRELRPLFRSHGMDIKYFRPDNRQEDNYYRLVKADVFSTIQDKIMKTDTL